MNTREFIDELKEALGTSMCIEAETLLSDIPEWDSLTMMSIVTLLASEFSVFVTITDLKDCIKVSDIIAKIGVLS